MRSLGRTELLCRKVLPNKIVEMFTVIVKSNEKDVAVKKYQSLGYDVTCKKQETGYSFERKETNNG